MELTIIQQIILGIIQGITEWLPISSSGFLTLVMINFFEISDIKFLLHSALLLHLGTFFSAFIYFRKDVFHLIKGLFKYKYQDESTKKTISFLFIATLISGILGIIFILLLNRYENEIALTGKSITFFVGILLFFTGIIQIKIKNKGLRKERQIKKSDSFILGISQGITPLPGVSRSGITISALLLRNFDDTTALRLSFLLSLPIILFGNLLLNYPDLVGIFSSTSLYGLLASFVFGILTIHGLMKLSKRINFGLFVLIFAVLMMLSVLII